MGMPGIAFLYVRRELIEQLQPTVTGWFGRANPFAFDAKALDWSPTREPIRRRDAADHQRVHRARGDGDHSRGRCREHPRMARECSRER